jgi:hypothetical protein
MNGIRVSLFDELRDELCEFDTAIDDQSPPYPCDQCHRPGLRFYGNWWLCEDCLEDAQWRILRRG